MKEFRAIAINPALLEEGDDKLVGFAEVIIVMSEPNYRVDDGGGLVRQRVMSEVRFGMGSKAMREFSAHLIEYADELDKLADRASLTPQKPPPIADGR